MKVMKATEQFKTERLQAERLNQSHLAGLTAIHVDPEVSRYIGGVRSEAETAAYLQANMRHWDENGFGLWGISTLAGEFAGRAGIRRIIVDYRPEYEIAHTLARRLWGQGLASESGTTSSNCC